MQRKMIVALITFLVTVFGTVSNALVFLAARRMNSMNSSFGIITKNQAICNFLMSLIFLVYIFPLQISDIKLMVTYSRFIGLIVGTIYEISNLSHFLIASNRFCAVFLPFHYDNIFTIFKTKILRNLIWVTSAIWCMVFYELIGCKFSYDVESWSLVFLATEMCTQLTWYTDFTFNTSLVVLTLITNLLTAFKAGRNSRMLVTAAIIKKSKQQKQRELNFIKQSFLQGLSVFSGQVTYYLIAPILSNPVLIFCFGTMYVFMHSIEGAIILASNQEMRSALKPRKGKSRFKERLTTI
ncbi:Protein CBG19212 [Caenorhabditis briggsae]|uniref:Protein CBG19053 n=1 Tax=Caenorhabditis briggsae TaxID=6238 RepID=G2J6Z0_CAEBR|nr:Protein CBG19053 [Caenorhabditis briggsae]XP_002637492.2 Protein CBG19212 [Caenorhabditis briggsae]CAP36361.2 Protein CBG19053 [Caenorhabditis briggsae]CAP36500.2 Protein CBG19212 [Caenorhabditis briggsae]